jgi:hypothetical protein
MRSRFLTSRRTETRRWLAAGVVFCLMAGHAAAQSSACADARVGTAVSYNCLNRELQKQVVRQHQGGADVSMDATSPAPAVGTYNQAGVREHLGSSFGKSAVPQRPSAPVFASPLIPAR